MKTVLKLHIVFILLLSGYVLANPINSGLNETESDGKITKVKRVHLFKDFSTHSGSIEGLDQSTFKLQTQKYGTFYSAPKIYGGFQYYYSVQFILPDIRAGQSFGIQLKI